MAMKARCAMDSLPNIHPSSDADWKNYYQKKEIESDKQLKDLAWAFAHMLHFAMNGQKEDAIMLSRRVLNRLKFPRDKQDIEAELKKYPEYAKGILRDD